MIAADRGEAGFGRSMRNQIKQIPSTVLYQNGAREGTAIANETQDTGNNFQVASDDVNLRVELGLAPGALRVVLVQPLLDLWQF